MRMSADEYILPSGEIVAVEPNVSAEVQVLYPNAKLWNGYNYERQEWVFKGQKDIRTLAELKASLSLNH